MVVETSFSQAEVAGGAEALPLLAGSSLPPCAVCSLPLVLLTNRRTSGLLLRLMERELLLLLFPLVASVRPTPLLLLPVLASEL